MSDIENKIQNLLNIPNIDLVRCYKAKQNIAVNGLVTDNRKYLIEEAISLIQKNGKTAFKSVYLGIKNYASFGDQREDHSYGYVPRHGSIVFEIERKNRDKEVELGKDEIYFLEAVRDFGVVEIQNNPFIKNSYNYNDIKIKISLSKLLDIIKSSLKISGDLLEMLETKEFYFHV